MALLQALKRGELSQAQALLAAGADPEASSDDQSSDFPLKVAAKRGYLDLLVLLLQAGANPEQKGYNGSTALSAACLSGHLDIVKQLVAAGANFCRGDDFGHTPLFWAVAGGHLPVVRCLFAQGASFTQRAQDGSSPLYRSASGLSRPEHTEILRFFLEHGADPDYCGPHGCSLLMAAALGGNLKTVQILLQAGADIQARTERQEAILSLVCRSSKDQPEIVSVLIQAGAELNILDQWQGSPLLRASEQGLLESVKLLIAAGLSPNQPNCILTQAICHGKEDVALFLLQAGADLDPPDSESTPLMEALARRQYGLARVLIEAGANLEARNKYGTVLTYALGVMDGYLYERRKIPKLSTPFIQFLLSRGVSLDSTKHSISPLQLAKNKGLKQIARSLSKQKPLV